MRRRRSVFLPPGKAPGCGGTRETALDALGMRTHRKEILPSVRGVLACPEVSGLLAPSSLFDVSALGARVRNRNNILRSIRLLSASTGEMPL